MYIPVSEDFISNSRYIIRLLIRVSVSLFLWLFRFVFGYIVTECTYIGTSLISRYCLSFPLAFSVSGYIIDNLHVCEQARSGRSVCNSALEHLCIIINSACKRTSIDSYFYLSLWLWMSVPVSGYVITDCMCIYVSWSCLFLSSLWRSVVVFGYIVIDCRCIFPSFDPCFSLSFSLNTFLSVELYYHWLYVQKYVSWSVFLSLSLCLFQCLLILSVIVCIYVSLLIRISFSLSLNVCSSVSLCYQSL